MNKHIPGLISEEFSMSPKRIFTFALGAVMLFFVFSSMSYAQGRAEPRERGFRGDRERIHTRLNLTEEQDATINTLRAEHRKKMIDIRSEIRKIQVDLEAELKADNPDMNKVEGLVKQQENLRTTQRLGQISHRNEVSALLTPEQREIYNQRYMGYRDTWDRRGGMRRGGNGRW
jgi:Spy/CpxP family protein refolding chaperone